MRGALVSECEDFVLKGMTYCSNAGMRLGCEWARRCVAMPQRAGMALPWRLRMAVEGSAAYGSAHAHTGMKAHLNWGDAEKATARRRGAMDVLRKPVRGDDSIEETFTYPRKCHLTAAPSEAVPPSDMRRPKTL
ncbi:hypothetical protein GCM10017744_076350 [Streptomyces antimycoticus]